MRNIDNLDEEEQKTFIRKYVEDYCNFQKYGVEIESFIDHRIEDTCYSSKKFVVGSYQVSEDADFSKIELKMKIFDVHKYFIIFAIL